MALFVAVGISIGHAAPGIPDQVIERQAERGGWKYHAAFNKAEGRIDASVEYAMETVQQVRGIVAIQRQLARELIADGASSLDVTVVFRRPLNQVEFERLVTDAGPAQISGYTLRYLDNQGQRVTIHGAPDNGVLVPQDMLNIALTDLQQRAPGKLLGWIQAQATITPTSYAILLKNPGVYLIDVSRSAIRSAYAADVGASNPPVDLITPQLYWKLEDAQIVSN
jgi:hypothetical protein